MVTHIVLMNLHDTNDCDFVSKQVHSLAGRVPGLSEVRGGSSVVQLKTTWDLGFMMQFTDENSVLNYQTHPAHIVVAGHIKEKIREMATCDLADNSFASNTSH